MDDFQRQFLQNLINECQCSQQDTFLLGVSGGTDSVVLTDLFKRSNITFGIAHCNFQLRGKDSTEDYLFVEQLAKTYKAPFFYKSFDTKNYAKKRKISIEMAARKLRYEWFEEIRYANNFDNIAVGHHADDLAETMLLNLIRGTGIRGITGIPVRNRAVVRPLLSFTKDEILKYAKARKLRFCTDLTNVDTSFPRNHIRHNVLPSLQKLNPSIIRTLNDTSHRFRQINRIYKQALKEFRENIMINTGDEYKLNIEKLKTYAAIDCFLFETIKEFGFNFSQVLDIIDALESIPGKIFYSKTHMLLRDRDFLIIKSQHEPLHSEYTIASFNFETDSPVPLKIELTSADVNYKNNQNEAVAYFDAAKLKLPLKLRKWQKGDRFMPLGMQHEKKLSDFFSDNKYSAFDKENTWLLLSENRIVWVVCKRIDERFKVEKNTRHICRIEVNSLYEEKRKV